MKKTVSSIGKLSVFTFLASLLLWGCTNNQRQEAQQTAQPETAKGPVIYTVNYPLQYFSQYMIGAWADVRLTAPPHVDPAYWMPDQEQVLSIQKGDLLIINGADYAKWLDKVSIPSSKLVNTSSAFKDQYLKVYNAVTHSHGPDGEHSHEGIDFNTWLDPQLATQQAKAAETAFTQTYPEKAAVIQQKAAELYRLLEELDKSFEEITALNPSMPLIASHPVYGYFAHRYGLNIESLHWEPDTEPSEEEWEALTNLLEKHPAEWIIWEANPLPKIKSRLEEMGVKSTVFQPCANEPATGNYLSVMRQNVENFKPVFSPAE